MLLYIYIAVYPLKGTNMFLIGKEVSQIEDMYKDEEDSCKLLRLLETLVPYTFIGDKGSSSNPFIKKYNSLVAEVRVYLTYIEDIHQESSRRIKVPSLNDLMMNIDTLENVCVSFKASDPNAILYATLSSIIVLKDTFQDFIEGVASANVGLGQKSAIATGSSTVWMTGDTSVKAAVQSESKLPSDLASFCKVMDTKTNEYMFCSEFREYDLKSLKMVMDQSFMNNVFVIGDSGSGKTSLIHQLVVDLGADAICVNPIALISNTRYRGEAEARISNVFQYALKNDVIVYFDEINAFSKNPEIINAIILGTSMPKIKVIASCTNKDYSNIFADNTALLRRFEILRLSNIPPIDVKSIVKQIILSHKYADMFGSLDETIDHTVDAIHKYRPTDPLISATIRALDTCLTSFGSMGLDTISASSINSILGIKDLNEFDPLDVEPSILKRIFGQNHIVEEVSKYIRTYLCGMNPSKKPIGSFLFTGQTGTGKTELAKVICDILGFNLIKINMSDYSTAHTVSGLIGSPSGYIGHDSGGVLTNQLMAHPKSVILLDEVEKAHPDVFNIFLNMLDEGYIVDAKGQQISCVNCFIFLTSNITASVETKSSIGFNSKDVSESDKMKEVTKFFRPEFLARLNEVMTFNALDIQSSKFIARKHMQDIVSRNSEIKIEYTEEALEKIAREGFDKAVGGRSIASFINRKVVPLLCEEICKRTHNGQIHISVINDELAFN
jgi:ATP-dependent Clp protease ATP-binding subunit ClpA